MQRCPLCEESPKEDLSKMGYKFFYCSCGAADSGPITGDAIARWNGVVENRKTLLLIAIAKKLGITVTDPESKEAYNILTGKGEAG